MKFKHRIIISFALIIILPVAFFPLAKILASSTTDLVILMIAILCITTSVLIAWTYSGFVPRMNEMTRAANNIKEGNLDFTIQPKGHDELTELAASFEDMRKRLQDNAKEKLETEAEQKALLSNIAHDLKTPLTAIRGYAEGIQDGIADTPEKQAQYLKMICSKAAEMNTLINELTLYSRIDTNRIPYNFMRLNVKNYFGDCAEELGMELKEKGIEMNYFNYVGSQEEIIADPEQLARVIHNIVGNSVKYMDKSRGRIDLRILDVGDFIQVEMEDNGRGIEARDLPYIFDRMYRADASRNSAIGGSGIGLSIVKKIVEDHGGKIWATSREGEGTCMYFVIRKYQEVIHEQDTDY